MNIFWSQLISHPLRSFQHWFINYLLVTRIILSSMFLYYWWFLYLIKFALQKKYRKNRETSGKRPKFIPEQKPKPKHCRHYMKGRCHEVVINSVILNPDLFFTLYHDTFMLVLNFFYYSSLYCYIRRDRIRNDDVTERIGVAPSRKDGGN